MPPLLNAHIVILGGGPCGLYAARTLTQHLISVTVLDKGIRPGGLATSQLFGNNWYDSGVHMLHAFDRDIFEDIKTLMGEERIEVPLNAVIKHGKYHFRYPLQFQDMIKGIPFFSLCRQVFHLFLAQFKNYIAPWQPQNAEEALIQLYGKPLYQYFFEGFTHRYWQLHPRELSATFITTKMPKLTAVDVFKKALEKIGIKERAKSTESALTQETLHYSATGAEAMPRHLAKAITQAGGQVIQNAEVVRLVAENNQIQKVIYRQQDKLHELQCDACISTIPINTLACAIEPICSESILTAAKQIRYKPIVIFGLLVKKPKCLNGLYVYYRNHIFHRVGEPKNGGLTVNPADHTVLIVEMTCELNDEKWRGEQSVQQQVFKELAEENICQPEDIVEMHLLRHETGYPIFFFFFETSLGILKSYIAEFKNLQSVGRQGAFTYPNMHTAMRMGKKAAETIIEQLS